MPDGALMPNGPQDRRDPLTLAQSGALNVSVVWSLSKFDPRGRRSDVLSIPIVEAFMPPHGSGKVALVKSLPIWYTSVLNMPDGSVFRATPTLKVGGTSWTPERSTDYTVANSKPEAMRLMAATSFMLNTISGREEFPNFRKVPGPLALPLTYPGKKHALHYANETRVAVISVRPPGRDTIALVPSLSHVKYRSEPDWCLCDDAEVLEQALLTLGCTYVRYRVTRVEDLATMPIASGINSLPVVWDS